VFQINKRHIDVLKYSLGLYEVNFTSALLTRLVCLQAIESAVNDQRTAQTTQTASSDVDQFIQTHLDEMERIESGLG